MQYRSLFLLTFVFLVSCSSTPYDVRKNFDDLVFARAPASKPVENTTYADKPQAADPIRLKIPDGAGVTPIHKDEAQKILDEPFRKWKTGIGYVYVPVGIRNVMGADFEISVSSDGFLKIGIKFESAPESPANYFFLFKMAPPIEEVYGPIKRCLSFKSGGVDKVVVFEAARAKNDDLVALAYIANASPANPKLGSMRGGANADLREKLCEPGAYLDSPRVEDFFVEAGEKSYLFWGTRLKTPR